MRRASKSLRTGLLGSTAIALLLAAVQGLSAGPPVPGEDGEKRGRGGRARDDDEKPSADLESWGRLGKAYKGTEVHDLTLYQRDERGKVHSKKVLVEIPESVDLLLDRRIRVEQIKEGEKVCVFGRVVEREVRGGGGGGRGGGGRRSGMDRQIQQSQVVLVGNDVKFNEKYKDRRSPESKWCDGHVSQDGTKGLWINHQNGEYRVILDRQAPVLKREAAKREYLKSGRYIQLAAARGDENPIKTTSAQKLEFYVAKDVVLLDRRLPQPLYFALTKDKPGYKKE